MRRRLREEERQELARQYVDGVPTAQIAKNFGVSESYPSQLAARYNLKRRMRCHARDAVARAAEERHSLADSLVDEIAAPASMPAKVHTVLEIRRLHGLGRKRSEIAALLRCPYREIEAALA